MLLYMALLLAILLFVLGRKKPGIALITMSAACGVFVFIIISIDNNPDTIIEILFAIPILIIATLSAIQLTRREQGRKVWPLACAKWLLLGFVFLLIGAIWLCAIVEVPAFGSPVFTLIVVVITLAGAAINFGLTSRSSTATYVISTIGASMRQNLPLPMALESAAAGRDDKRSRILQNISKWLVQGYPVSEAIKRGFPKCPSYAIAMIAAAGRINQLPQALKSIEADMASKSDQSKQMEPVSLYYPLVLFIFLCFITWGIMAFVIPLFSEILTEMTDGAEFPEATQILFRIVSFVGFDQFFVMMLLFIVFVVLPFCVYVRFRQRRPNDPYTSSKIGDFFKWHLPVLRSFERNYSALQVVEMLRLSLNAGATVNDAISNALCLDVNNCFKKRLQAWLDKVEAGENIGKAAKQSGIGGSLAWAFDANANQGNAPAILETLESLHRSNYNYRANLVSFIASPCITLIMAAMVGFVVYAIYSAPIAIIHHLAEAVYP